MVLMRMHDEASPAIRVLVVEKQDQSREALAATLEQAGLDVVEAGDGLRGWMRFRERSPHAVIAGFDLPGLSGLGLLRRVRQVSTALFLLEASQPDVSEAVRAMREGADDVLCLPNDLESAAQKICALLGSGPRGRALRAIETRVVGRNPAVVRLREQLCAVANLTVPVLLRGEVGTGRSHAVRAILTAAGLDPAELCVVRPRTAPNGGLPSRPGPFYLEAVEEFAPVEQARWASLVCTASPEKNGPTPRVFASASTDLQSLARAGRFHVPLASRLERFAIELPPLRERLSDIGPLANHLAARAARRMGKSRVKFTAPAIRLLQKQSWPGNIRQLEATVEKLVAFAPEGQVSLRQVGAVLRETPASVDSLRREAERRQREELLEHLNATGGNLSAVARRIGKSRGAVIYRAQKFGLLPKKS